tara:strand:- start:115 stop:228 length:114 start_codon:yes stop_codon:yes gene_type:complete
MAAALGLAEGMGVALSLRLGSAKTQAIPVVQRAATVV